jgi:hypothetical protein
VDESRFAYKPKYHRGRASEEERCVFDIADTSFRPAQGYMEYVSDRSSATLLPIIQRVCLPGTVIVSDGRAAYPAIQNMGFDFKSVNHKQNFVDPITGIHTQNVESYWNKQKLSIKKMKGMKRKYKEMYLWEFMWRDRFIVTPFDSICSHIKRYYIPLNNDYTPNSFVNENNYNSDNILFDITDDDISEFFQ